MFIKGLCIGFLIAAPVGPIGLLCVMRTFSRGFISGLATGLGAATADGVYGCIAGFGVTIIASTLIEGELWIRSAGGLFLVYLGVRHIFLEPAPIGETLKSRGLVADYASTFLLTLTNPMTIVFFVAVFTNLGMEQIENNHWTALWLIAGVFAGSALWWLTLSLSVSILRRRFSIHRLRCVNKIAGVIIALLGAAGLISALLGAAKGR